jgi:NhaA family Na+:H+ antiporter
MPKKLLAGLFNPKAPRMIPTKLFIEFFNSEKAVGIVLIACTAISLILTNFLWPGYHHIWEFPIAGHSFEHWINDGLMAIFFLLIGMEMEREVYIGELSSLKNAALPMVAALGGMVVPAGFYALFNMGTDTAHGVGIPMATDIAFALGILSLVGKRVPFSLKILLTALAVIDDLGAIIIIALFYTSTLSVVNLAIAMGIFGVLLIFNRMKVFNLWPYLIGGVVMWYFMLNSGVHATITGVLVAFAIPFGDGGEKSLSYRMQHFLHKPVAFLIMPLFALANTSIIIESDWYTHLGEPVSLGIFAGLLLGKPVGIVLFSFIAVALGLCALPASIKWRHMFGIGLLGGIGFTMSIFITLLAFDDAGHIVQSKITILLASLVAGILGYFYLKKTLRKKKHQAKAATA